MAIDLSFGGTAFPRSLEVRQHLYDSGTQGLSTRYRVLDRRDAYYKCLEYAHLEFDWNGNKADNLETISPDALVPYGFVQPAVSSIPVRMRRPTAPLRMCPMIVDRFSDMLFAEGRIPDVGVDGDPAADAFLREVVIASGFWGKAYGARTFGGSMGSVLMTVHLSGGRMSFKAHSPKVVADIVWADRDDFIPEGVLIQYPTIRQFEVVDKKTGRSTGEVREQEYLYRRIIDSEWDVVFKEAPIVDGEMPAEMEVDTDLSRHHQLGKFPGVWIQNLPCDDDIDGVPDCDGAYQMFDTIDRQVSQVDHGLIYNADPTLVLSRDPKMKRQGGAIRKGSEHAIDVGLQGSATYLEIGATGLQATREFARDLRQWALDKTSCVLSDPSKTSGAAQSALAIELLYEPMLAKTGRMREQYGVGFRSLFVLALELARKWSQPVMYHGNAVPKFDLPKRRVTSPIDPDDPESEVVVAEVDQQPGTGGRVTLTWGPYFTPTPTEVQVAVSTIANAVNGGLMDVETGVRQMAPKFGIKDVDGLVKKVKAELAKREQQRADALAAQQGMGESDLADAFASQMRAGAPPDDLGGAGE